MIPVFLRARGRRGFAVARAFPFRETGYLGADMFPHLVRVIVRRPPPEYDRGFVEEVRLVEFVRARQPRVAWLLLVCWALIAAKCALVVWLVEKYHLWFDPLWVTAPTVACALLCTAIYFRRE